MLLKKFVICLFSFVSVNALGATISEVKVEGNKSIQSEAVIGLMTTKAGQTLSPVDLKSDVRSIFRSGFFEDVRVVEEKGANDTVKIIVYVTEKPSIKEIKFSGFNEIKESSFSDKLQIKRYTIVDEKKIAADLRLIEQQYVEKGFYLARATYTLTTSQSGEVVLTYMMIESDPVSVGRVNVLGNSHLSDQEIKSNLATREKRWLSWLTGAGTFKDEFVNRDKEFIAYVYRDTGFAEATVGAPQSRLQTSRRGVEVSFYVEEGERFNIGRVTVSGDVIFSADKINEKFELKEGGLYRISQFQKDISALTDLYGDEGYAFVDVFPKSTLNREKKTIDIEYVITKGEKVYFRSIFIQGNGKTRDNVIRRNLKVSEGERFSSTKLSKSEAALNRLGYFSEVKIGREADHQLNVMDLRITVKEKPTGTLTASLGAAPSANGREFNFFAQGQYSEKNLLGKGWETDAGANVSPTGDYGLNLAFTEPSINDGPWNATLYGWFKYQRDDTFKNEQRYTRTRRTGISVGRELIEDLRVSLGYSYEMVTSTGILPVYYPYTKNGDTERLTQTLSYDKTDSYIQPTSGYSISLSNTLGINVLGGEHHFGKAEASASLYVPLVFGDSFKTNFRFAFEPGYAYSLSGKAVPVWERFTLGSQLDMRAYSRAENVISPRVELLAHPYYLPSVQNVIGGNRRLYGVAEYFVPIIPEANLRMVFFAESGTVLNDNESFTLDSLRHDVGFGFRWQTPIAPFRFEWAWALEKGRLGNNEFIFFIGIDSASRFSF